MIQISCRDVCIGYENKIALDDVSLDILQGDYLCVVGENGSGKSTFIKGLLGLMPLKSGKININKEIKSNGMGYLPQQTVIQRDFPASVFEVVISGCLKHRGLNPFYSSAEKKLALENMKKLGIEELKKKSYRDLSGGQQQRVLLARALCATKNILILDEPVTGLDPIMTSEFYQIVKRLNKDSRITIIMVSHDIASSVQQSNKILHLSCKVLFYGTTEEYILSNVSNNFIGGINND